MNFYVLTSTCSQIYWVFPQHFLKKGGLLIFIFLHTHLVLDSKHRWSWSYHRHRHSHLATWFPLTVSDSWRHHCGRGPLEMFIWIGFVFCLIILLLTANFYAVRLRRASNLPSFSIFFSGSLKQFSTITIKC